eukprot:2676119-Rhodomonas_salina.1
MAVLHPFTAVLHPFTAVLHPFMAVLHPFMAVLGRLMAVLHLFMAVLHPFMEVMQSSLSVSELMPRTSRSQLPPFMAAPVEGNVAAVYGCLISVYGCVGRVASVYGGYATRCTGGAHAGTNRWRFGREEAVKVLSYALLRSCYAMSGIDLGLAGAVPCPVLTTRCPKAGIGYEKSGIDLGPLVLQVLRSLAKPSVYQLTPAVANWGRLVASEMISVCSYAYRATICGTERAYGVKRYVVLQASM